ncbi:hypothetical protein OVA24_17400 [Luteolibacter sp. SL250]|uniref:hypothetical protein n=1 Tax=Luteolibacter sp. SL250 TaxID=2995170 RepID=UPI00226FBBA7|nr:hypothetical protein [Luteolibacter sp. SL250]WAC19008.1 hypothetical protein OVA24_17400 [Luteolibacter sp. SL250]
MRPLRNALPYLLLPAGGLLAGWATAPAGNAGGGKDAGGAAAREIPVSPRMREARAAGAPMTPDQLLAEARRLADAPAKKSRRTTLDETISGWTDAEVVAALEQAAREPDLLLEQDSMAGDLLRSFSKRDPEKAMRWALEQPLLVRRKFAGHVLSALLPGRYDEALAMAKAHPDLFDGKVPTNVVRAAVTGSARQGAAAFVSRLRQLMEDGSAPFMEFPDDVGKGFDFAAALDSPDFAPLASHKLRDSMIHAWVRDERDAAFRWVLEKDGPGRLGNLLDIRRSHAELTGQVNWMAGKLEALPQEEWQTFLDSTSHSLHHREGHAQLWLEALREPVVRESFRDVAVSAIFSGGPTLMERGLKALDGLPDGEARIRRLETLVQEHTGYRSRPDPSSAAMLRGKLEQWGADPARADAIIGRMNPQEP